MSISSSFLLVLLLCLSLHACDARRLAAADEKFHISNKINDEKKQMSVATKVKPSSSLNKAEQSITKTHQLADNGEHHKSKESSSKKAKDHKLIIKAEDQNKNISRKSGAIIGNKEAVVPVPWRVPHNKHGEKHPGFNLDYSPPKTHPPSHN